MQVRKDSSQVRTSITVFSQATSGSLRAVEVTAADTGISLWVRDDGTILSSLCFRITDISIPDLTLKIFECRLFAICISPSTVAIAALSVYVRTWIASSSFSTETPSLRSKGTTHML